MMLEQMIDRESDVWKHVVRTWDELCVRVEYGAGGTPGIPDFFLLTDPRIWIECKVAREFPVDPTVLLGIHQKKFIPKLLSNEIVCVLVGKRRTKRLCLYRITYATVGSGFSTAVTGSPFSLLDEMDDELRSLLADTMQDYKDLPPPDQFVATF